MKFYNIANHDTAAKSAVIQIMEQIGYDWWTDKGVEATEFINDVRGLGDLDEVFLEINSPGGNVYDGVSIANFIKSHKAEWSACVIGQAASIATVIASACKTVEMGIGTNYLVHKPMSAMGGYVNADDLRSLATDLDTIEDSVIDFYLPLIEAKGKTKDELLALMTEDRYMSADEALEWGFVTSKSTDIEAVAFVDAKQAGKAGSLEAVVAHQTALINALTEAQAKGPDLEQELTKLSKDELSALVMKYEFKPVEKGADAEFIAKACTDANVTHLINGMLAGGLSTSQVESKITTATSLRTICASSNINSDEIVKNMDDSAAMLRHAITEAAALAEPEQDPSTPSDKDDPAAKLLDTSAIYAQRNKIGK